MKQKTFVQRPVYLFSTQVMLNGVKCTCRIYSRTILLFPFVFFFRFFDNVSVIRFMLSLVKLFCYNLSKGENRKDVSILNTTCMQSGHPSFYVKLHVPTKSTIPH